MSSFLQSGSSSRPRTAFRPAIVGALTCGALMVPAGTAQGYHVMADGTLCPHARGELQPGESKAAPTIERAASTAPIGARGARSAPAARPAVKPAAKAPVQRPAAQAPAQRPATQAQAQQPASTQARAQRPATAAQAATSRAKVAVPAQRQGPVAKPSVSQPPRAGASQRSGAERQVARPAVEPVVVPEITTDQRSAPVERPTAGPAAVASPADGSGSVPVTMLAAMLGLCGIIVAGVAVLWRRVVRVKSAAPSPRRVEPADATIEAELQEMIAEAKAAAAIDRERDEREVRQAH